MYELLFTACVVIGLLVIALGIATLSWPIAAAGTFLVVTSEGAAWLHSRGGRK